jgi:circadian clock protein KaiC
MTETSQLNETIISRCSSGIEGLDDILGGGLPAGRVYLLEGEPGTGKTTIALQFVAEGLRRKEKVLYVTLSESRDELLQVAKVHGIPVDGVHMLELRPSGEELKPEAQYTVFHPAEVELNDRAQTIMSQVHGYKPDRLIIDALSEVRMLAKDPFRYRRQVLSLKEYAPKNCTVLLLDDRTSRHAELELHSIVHGVITLERIKREYGKTLAPRRSSQASRLGISGGLPRLPDRRRGREGISALGCGGIYGQLAKQGFRDQRHPRTGRTGWRRLRPRNQHAADRSRGLRQNHDRVALAD